MKKKKTRNLVISKEFQYKKLIDTSFAPEINYHMKQSNKKNKLL